jgi:arylsulfatase A-like enzyme
MFRPIRTGILALALIGAGCASGPPPPPVLLVTIDTLRPDRLGCYGYPHAATPRIDRLAAGGVLFERATTSLPRTTQSVASILTGRYPRGHGARGLFSFLPAANRTLAEILKERGYATGAILSNVFLRPGQGFEQGFDHYDNPPGRWDGDSAATISAAAIAWIDARPPGRPWFLWVHYLDPHWTYEPGPPWDGGTAARPAARPSIYADLETRRISKGEVIFGGRIDAATADRLRALYDGEIGRTDAALGPLLDRVAGLDSANPPLIVLTSDHGESLGEHGYHFAHGEYLYEPGLRVPLLFSRPGTLAPGTRSAALTQNVDIAPTILALIGLGGMPAADGRPLFLPAARGSPAPFRPAPGRDLVFAESDFQLIHPENLRYHIPGPAGRWSAVSDGRLKVIRIPRPGGEVLETYDLAADPGETRPLPDGAADPAARARLLRALLEFTDQEAGAGAVLPSAEELEEQRERLRSLGYVN